MLSKKDSRKKRHRSLRKRVNGTNERPRLAVFRSTRHIYAQVINDLDQKTLVSAADIEEALRAGAGKAPKKERAKQVVPPEVSSEKNKLPPSDYFRRNFYFTIETEEPELPEAIEFLGAKHFLFATDYPHDDPGRRMKFKDVELLQANQKISETDKELIRSENAKRLFKIL